MPIDAACNHCGKAYKVSSKFAGKKAKCTACGNSFSIPGTAAESPPADEGFMSGLADAATSEVHSAAPAVMPSKRAAVAPSKAAPPVVPASQCPNCRQVMDISAVVCINCGYNRKTGKAMQTKLEKETLPVARSQPAPSSSSRGWSIYGGSGMSMMVVGGIICVLGIAATVGSGGHTIWYGAIVVGGIRCIMGLVKMMSGN